MVELPHPEELFSGGYCGLESYGDAWDAASPDGAKRVLVEWGREGDEFDPGTQVGQGKRARVDRPGGPGDAWSSAALPGRHFAPGGGPLMADHFVLSFLLPCWRRCCSGLWGCRCMREGSWSAARWRLCPSGSSPCRWFSPLAACLGSRQAGAALQATQQACLALAAPSCAGSGLGGLTPAALATAVD